MCGAKGVTLSALWGCKALGSGWPLGEASCSCHGVQGLLLAPFAWFATPKCQLGAPQAAGALPCFSSSPRTCGQGGAPESTLQSADPGRTESWTWGAGRAPRKARTPCSGARGAAQRSSAPAFAGFPYWGVAPGCAAAWERDWVCLGGAEEGFWEQGEPDRPS